VEWERALAGKGQGPEEVSLGLGLPASNSFATALQMQCFDSRRLGGSMAADLASLDDPSQTHWNEAFSTDSPPRRWV